MTVSNSTYRVSYNGNGSTTSFSIPFYFINNSDLLVTKQNTDGSETAFVLGTDYNLTGAGDLSGGTLTTTAILITNEKITIERDAQFTQSTDYEPFGRFPAETLEQNIDKLTMLSQQVKALTDRVPLLDKTTSFLNRSIAEPVSGSYLIWGSSGDIESAVGSVNTSTYTFPDASAVSRTVTNRLSEKVSVKDFGAVGDGTTDDTSACQYALDNYDHVVFPEGSYAVTNLTTTRAQQVVEFSNAQLKGIASSSTTAIFRIRKAQSVFYNLNVNGNYNTNYTAAIRIDAASGSDYPGKCAWFNTRVYSSLIGILIGDMTSPVDAPVSENHFIGGDFRDVERNFVCYQPNGFTFISNMTLDCQRYEWELVSPGSFSYSRSCSIELYEGWMQFTNCSLIKAQTPLGYLVVNGNSTAGVAGTLVFSDCQAEAACPHFFGYNESQFTINGWRTNWFNNATGPFIRVDNGSSGNLVATNLYYTRASAAAAEALIDSTTAEGWFFHFANCEFQEQNIGSLLEGPRGASTLSQVEFVNCYTNDTTYGKVLLDTSNINIDPGLIELPVGGVGSAPPAAQWQTTVGGTSILVQTDAGTEHNQCIDMIAGAGINQLFSWPAAGKTCPYLKETGILEFWQKAIAGANGFNASIIMYYDDSGTNLGNYTLTDGTGGIGKIANGNTSAVDWHRVQIVIPGWYPKATKIGFEFRQQATSQQWKIAGVRVF